MTDSATERAGRYAAALKQISELVGLDTNEPSWAPEDAVAAVDSQMRAMKVLIIKRRRDAVLASHVRKIVHGVQREDMGQGIVGDDD